MNASTAIVSGRVQTYGFRANTEKQAKKLRINGWVRNLADGSFEVKACGTTEDLERFIKWLHRGPDAACVDNVTITQIDIEEFVSLRFFEIRPKILLILSNQEPLLKI